MIGDAVVKNPRKMATGTFAGPASYNSIAHDLSGSFEWIDYYKVKVVTQGPNLPLFVQFEYQYNVTTVVGDTPGRMLFRVMRHRYNKPSSLATTLTSLPSGVTSQSSSTSTGAEAAHVHTINHAHSETTPNPSAAAGGAANLQAGGPNLLNHNHPFSIATENFNTGAGSSHSHTIGFLYDHVHNTTQSQTNLLSVDITAGTNLSGTTFAYVAFGQ